MEYMHVNVRGGGNKPDALEEFATALVAIADRDGDEIKALGVKPACLRGVAYGLLCHEKIEELCVMNKYFGADKELRIAKSSSRWSRARSESTRRTACAGLSPTLRAAWTSRKLRSRTER